MPNQKMNYCNKPNFLAARAMLAAFAPGNDFTVARTFLDYGAGMEWETIICATATGSSYQVLSPRDWDVLEGATRPADIAAVVDDILKGQASLLGLNVKEDN